MRALDPERYHQIAAKHGGKCLRPPRVNRETGRFRCAHGHEWEPTGGNVIGGSWCPHCAGVAPKTPEDYQRAAARHGGKCLVAPESTIHYGRWECAKGHRWEAVGGSIIRAKAHWCPFCATRERAKS